VEKVTKIELKEGQKSSDLIGLNARKIFWLVLNMIYIFHLHRMRGMCCLAEHLLAVWSCSN